MRRTTPRAADEKDHTPSERAPHQLFIASPQLAQFGLDWQEFINLFPGRFQFLMKFGLLLDMPCFVFLQFI
jgi:hypothetical protein